jgi:hypothetical protein
MDGIESILFGASSRANIKNSKELIDSYSKPRYVEAGQLI